MVEMEMPRDIRKVKAKLIGPFTLRECICLVLGLGAAFVANNFLAGIGLSNDTKTLAIIVVCIPFAACGWIFPYGLPFEQFAKVVLFTTILSPRERKYKTEIEVEEVDDKGKKVIRKANKKYKSKEYFAYK